MERSKARRVTRSTPTSSTIDRGCRPESARPLSGILSRRRLEADAQQSASYAAAGFARDMLAIKDNLDRALVVVNDELRADKTASQFLAGIEATARELEAVFARQGITRINSIGEALDPHRHQAMIEIPTDQSAPGTIVEEMQAGYMMKDRLLRPALVGVAKKPD